MSKINKDDISEEENRALAKYKPFIINKQINYNYGKDFNNWFSDRFYLRKKIIDFQKTLIFMTTQKPTNGLIDKNTGFMYLDSEFRHYDTNTIKNEFKELYRLNEFCKNNNIKLYILITPQKTDIYPPQTNDFKINNNYHEDFLNYINQIKSEKELNVIYPYTELKNAVNENFMFFKTEHHWTDDGAFIGYKELMKEIKKDFPFVNSVKESDYSFSYDKKIRGDIDRKFNKYGTTTKKLHIPRIYRKKYHDVDYRYYKHQNFENLKIIITKTNLKWQKSFYYPKGENLKVVMLGTSQNENLTEFIPFTFKSTERMRLRGGVESYKFFKYYKKDILDFKPNILIFCMPYDQIKKLKYLFSEE